MKYLLPLFFLLLGLGELTRIQLPNAISFHIFDAFLLVFVLYWLRSRKGNYRLTKPIFVFILVAVISLILNSLNFASSELMVGVLYLLRWISYSLLYFVFRDLEEEDKKRSLKYMVYAGGLVVGLGLLQYILYPALGNLYYLGWDEHLSRLFSTFLDPNFAGSFLVLLIVFLFLFREKIPVNNSFIWTLSGLSLVSLILTYSRGAFVMLIACVVAYSVILRSYKILGALMGVSILVFLMLTPRFDQEGTNLLRTASVFQRGVSMKEGLSVFQSSPLYGVGFNTYRYAREDLGFEDKSKFGPSHSGAGVENGFIFVLATTGVAGIAAFLFLLYSMFKPGQLEETRKVNSQNQ